MKVRVQLYEKWDRMSFDVNPESPVASLKRDALAEFGLNTALAADYEIKLNGWEIRSELESVTASGAKDGSTFLVAYRRRKAVR